MIAYTLGPNGFDGENVVMTLFRYDYDGTKCSMDYIYNYGNNIIETSISNNKNTITFKKENVGLLGYVRIVALVI